MSKPKLELKIDGADGAAREIRVEASNLVGMDDAGGVEFYRGQTINGFNTSFVTIDFNRAPVQRIKNNADTSFVISTANWRPGAYRAVLLECDSGISGESVPIILTDAAVQRWVGPMPTGGMLARGKVGLLEMWCYGTTAADVVCRWTVQA